MNFKELLNGNYFIYQIADGGCGIVKAVNTEHAKLVVVNAYKTHHSGDYSTDDVSITKIEDGLFADMGNVFEVGWKIELN